MPKLPQSESRRFQRPNLDLLYAADINDPAIYDPKSIVSYMRGALLLISIPGGEMRHLTSSMSPFTIPIAYGCLRTSQNNEDFRRASYGFIDSSQKL